MLMLPTNEFRALALAACISALAPLIAVAQPLPPDPDSCEVPVAEDVGADYWAQCTTSGGPECDRWWHLRQTGILAARRVLAAVTGYGRCDAGAGVAVAQMDTGVIDDFSFPAHHSDDSWKQPLDTDSMHPLLRERVGGPYRIVTTALGQTLPLSYSVGPAGAPACKANELAFEGKACAARDHFALAVPRDTVSRSTFLGLALPGQRQPAHGTTTMHVLLQAAPGVTVVPYKFSGGIIATNGRSLQLSSALISAAMEDRLAMATHGRFDVVTMSLGRRSPSETLERALAAAEAEGIILVAAAGQWPIHGTRTRLPASFPGVIGVTGTTIDLRPWKNWPIKFRFQAGHGRNQLAAPAVGVWRASWKQKAGPNGQIGQAVYRRGNGTSFAAPLVAATAAMWIQRHGRITLDRLYGRAAVPSAFRLVLEKAGTRTPQAVCRELLNGGSGPWQKICQEAEPRWDTTSWGTGILAADQVLSHPLPSRDEVCADVLLQRGLAAHATLCAEPKRVSAVAPEAARLIKRPSVQKPARLTYLSGASLFGAVVPESRRFDPSVSAGVVFSSSEVEAPDGLFLQLTAARSMQEFSVGWAGIVDYAAYGPNRKLDSFPFFGPTLGVSVTATGLHEPVSEGSDRWWLGVKGQLTYYRFRLQHSWLWDTRCYCDRKLMLNLGVGF